MLIILEQSRPDGSGLHVPDRPQPLIQELPMTEIPDEDQTRSDDFGAARDPLAGDSAREIEPDTDEPEEPDGADRAREAGTGD
jgi:hypothetical protein